MTMAIYEIEGGAVLADQRPILDGLELTLPDRAVTAVVGPSGCGKSLLLYALHGRGLPAGVTVRGRWRCRGQPLAMFDAARTALVRQRRRGSEGGAWATAFDQAADVALLDEPEHTLRDADDRARLIEALRRQREYAAAVIVSHDLALVREVADLVVLVCAGRVDAVAPAARFFAAPPGELAARFVAQGNCWPRHPLPSHFHWVRPGLAGMGQPGLLGDVDADVAAIAAAGVGLLVSLTEQPIAAASVRPHGITARHFPVPDMGVPAVGRTMALCAEIGRSLAAGRGVAVHCHAGLGRTGTILAAYLVSVGSTADDAVAEVRRAIRGAIQSRAQLQFVYRFAEAWEGST